MHPSLIFCLTDKARMMHIPTLILHAKRRWLESDLDLTFLFHSPLFFFLFHSYSDMHAFIPMKDLCKWSRERESLYYGQSLIVLSLSFFPSLIQCLSISSMWKNIHSTISFNGSFASTYRWKATRMWNMRKSIVSRTNIYRSICADQNTHTPLSLVLIILHFISSDSSSLARHRRIHTGRRPYRCLVEVSRWTLILEEKRIKRVWLTSFLFLIIFLGLR